MWFLAIVSGQIVLFEIHFQKPVIKRFCNIINQPVRYTRFMGRKFRSISLNRFMIGLWLDNEQTGLSFLSSECLQNSSLCNYGGAWLFFASISSGFSGFEALPFR